MSDSQTPPSPEPNPSSDDATPDTGSAPAAPDGPPLRRSRQRPPADGQEDGARPAPEAPAPGGSAPQAPAVPPAPAADLPGAPVPPPAAPAAPRVDPAPGAPVTPPAGAGQPSSGAPVPPPVGEPGQQPYGAPATTPGQPSLGAPVPPPAGAPGQPPYGAPVPPAYGGAPRPETPPAYGAPAPGQPAPQPPAGWPAGVAPAQEPAPAEPGIPVVTEPEFPAEREPVASPASLDEGTFDRIREPRRQGLALDGAWHQISRKYVVSQVLQEVVLLALVVIAACVVFFVFDQSWVWIPAGIIVLMQVISLIILPRQAKALGYMLRGDDIVFRKGILWQRMVAVPYGRMQLIDITHGPLDRMFGVAKLKLVTAAATTGVEIPGLAQQAAEELRDTLIDVAETRRTGL
ncbi:PH domain-containing protein [Microbacterium sp. gxy059]|uniref:PH domain-containing protein n=1 Tax=Microbacterium sp. gxy059 TaxID=2957199 RepID=UPI003D9629B4